MKKRLIVAVVSILLGFSGCSKVVYVKQPCPTLEQATMEDFNLTYEVLDI